jgi:hypothetical protein
MTDIRRPQLVDTIRATPDAYFKLTVIAGGAWAGQTHRSWRDWPASASPANCPAAMSTRFDTNPGEQTLFKKFRGVFESTQDIECFDALVG